MTLLLLLLTTLSSCPDSTGSDTTDREPTYPQVIAQGEFPDMTVDRSGNLHVVYGRHDSLFYKKYDASTARWTAEVNPDGFIIRSGQFGIRRSDPDVVTDSQGHPHIFAGSDYTHWNGQRWIRVKPLDRDLRDTELGIDREDNVYLVHRGGNHTGDIGILRRAPDADRWEPLADPDNARTGMSDHVYPDLAVDSKNTIYVVQRHAHPHKGTQVNISYDHGKTWKNEKLTETEPESPHLVIDADDSVFVTHGGGEFFRRVADSTWVSEGYPVETEERTQPELAVDQQHTVYVVGWGGKYNIRHDDTWGPSRTLTSHTGHPIGFVEPAGGEYFAYLVWEEGKVDANEGAGVAAIVVGKIAPN